MTFLKDLVRELGDSEDRKVDRGVTEKLEARARRFQMSSGTGPSFEDFVKLYNSLGVPEEERNKKEDETSYRFNTIHISGFNQMIEKEDIGEFFEEFSPVGLEVT